MPCWFSAEFTPSGAAVPQDNLNAYKWAYIVSVGTRVEEFRNGSRQLMGVLEGRMTREDTDRAKAGSRPLACSTELSEAGRCSGSDRQSHTRQPVAPPASAASEIIAGDHHQQCRRSWQFPGAAHLRRQEESTSTRYWIAYPPDCASGSVFEIEEKPMFSRGLVWSGSVLAVLAAAAVGGAYLMYPDYFQPPTVTTGVATLGPVSEAVYGTGTVEPGALGHRVVPLQRRRLVELCRCEGQAVKVGQVLGRQDDAEEVSALHELEINNEQLAARSGSRQARSRQEATLRRPNTSNALLNSSNPNRGSAPKKPASIHSCFARHWMAWCCAAMARSVRSSGQPDVPFWVGPPAPMQVVAEINEEEITRIAVGQKAFLRTEAFSAQALRATVSQITPKGDPTRKTFRVYLLLPRDTPLRIGMTVEVNIIHREKAAAVVVPAEAVAANAVQVVSNGKIRRVPVTVGICGSRNVEIIGNVSKDTTVLSPARADLADGTRVRVENVAAKPATDAPRRCHSESESQFQSCS